MQIPRMGRTFLTIKVKMLALGLKTRKHASKEYIFVKVSSSPKFYGFHSSSLLSEGMAQDT